MECADLHYASDLKDKSNNFSLMDFKKNRVSQEKYPGIHSHAVFMISVF